MEEGLPPKGTGLGKGPPSGEERGDNISQVRQASWFTEAPEVSGKRDPELQLRMGPESSPTLSSFLGPSGVPRIQGSLLAFLEGRQGAHSCHPINALTRVCPCKGCRPASLAGSLLAATGSGQPHTFLSACLPCLPEGPVPACPS